MPGRAIKYHDYMTRPEIVKTCLECQRESCDGLCDDYKNAVRKLLGRKPLRPRDEKLVAHRPEKLGGYVPKAPKKAYVSKKHLEAYGESHTLREWAEITGIAYNTLYMRMLRRGMTIQESIETKPRKCCEPETITVDGLTLTVKQWAERLGVTPNCIHQRIYRGYSPEQAVTMGRMV